MSDNLKQAILCPNCRKLISGDEPVCPYCSVQAPGARWKQTIGKLGKAGSGSIVNYIIYVNVAFYVMTMLFSRSEVGLSANPLLFLSPSDKALFLFGASGSLPVLQLGRWWTLLSANYLHGGLLHIFFNMMILRQLSPLVIREYGINRFFAIYTIGGAAGYLLSCFAGVHFTIGASAAVCSLIGATLYYGKSRGGQYGKAVYKEVSSWVIMLAVFGLIVPGINNWGHGGGLLGGAAVAFILGYKERRKENLLHLSLAAICLTATVLILAWAIISGVGHTFTAPH